MVRNIIFIKSIDVKDRVSGFKGIAVSKHIYLNGCDRISVQPPYNKKEAKLPEQATFDEPDLIVIKKAKIKRLTNNASKLTGGPHDHSPILKY